MVTPAVARQRYVPSTVPNASEVTADRYSSYGSELSLSLA